jgi:RNA polymerase sigma-70 factor (ECF subfamily)
MLQAAENLLFRVASGDPEATRACLARYGGLVWGIARRFFGAGPDAEDAVQEAFLDLWRSAGRYDPKVSSEAVFVALIARRRFIDRRRRTQRRLDTEPLAPDAPSSSSFRESQRAEQVAEAKLASRALEQLRPEQRQVLLLAACHGMSHEEIAQATGMPIGTVKTHARRGLAAVRELLSLGVQQGESAGQVKQ